MLIMVIVMTGCSISSATPPFLWVPVASEAAILLSYMCRIPLGNLLELLKKGLGLLEDGITIIKNWFMLGDIAPEAESSSHSSPGIPLPRPRAL